MMKILCVCIAALLGLAALGSCGEPEPEAFAATITTNAPMASSTTEPPTEGTETSSAPTTKKVPADLVTLTAQAQTYPVGTEKITATWRRGAGENPDDIAYYGLPFTLQVLEGGAWADMEPVNQLLFLLPAYMLGPGESGEVAYDIGHYYGPLQAGRYRIAAYYHYDSERPIRESTPRHEVFAEFTVK